MTIYHQLWENHDIYSKQKKRKVKKDSRGIQNFAALLVRDYSHRCANKSLQFIWCKIKSDTKLVGCSKIPDTYPSDTRWCSEIINASSKNIFPLNPQLIIYKTFIFNFHLRHEIACVIFDFLKTYFFNLLLGCLPIFTNLCTKQL